VLEIPASLGLGPERCDTQHAQGNFDNREERENEQDLDQEDAREASHGTQHSEFERLVTYGTMLGSVLLSIRLYRVVV
jgi:hypothetical protein